MNALPLNRRALLAGLTGLAAGAVAPRVRAEDKFPSRPLRIIVGLPAGGVADNSVRLLAAALQPLLGQTVIVENKAGASFQLAMQAIAQAPADGTTLIHLISPMLSAQAVHKRFDIFKSLVPVVGMASTDTTFAVGGNSKFKSMQELIAYGRANPGKLTYGSPGNGTLEHIALAGFFKRYAIDAVHVPFKGGPEIVQALATGQIDLGTQAVPLVVQFAPKSMTRALVILNHKRNPAVPDVPTIKEAGMDLNRLTLWGGLAALAGTPKPLLELLEAKALAAARDPALLKQYQQMGLDSDPKSAAAFGQDWKDDWGWISKSAAENRIEGN